MPAPSCTSATPYPETASILEEVGAARPRDMTAGLTFALSRPPAGDRRAVVLVARRTWLGEHGFPCSAGFLAAGLEARAEGLVLAITRTETECLWAMEQVLRSGAASAVIGAVDQTTLAQSRRLDFAARNGGSIGLMLRTGTGDLSAARRRWTVTALTSAADADDGRAPGRFRLRAELVRSRNERPGFWVLEQDDETHRLRLADRLAGDGPDAIGRADIAA